MGKKLKPVIGQKFGEYEVISDEVFMVKNKNNNRHRGHFKVRCNQCGNIYYKRPDSLKSDSKKCRKCSNGEKYRKLVEEKKIAHKGYSVSHQGTGDLTKTQVLRMKYSAQKRNIFWDNTYMTTENLWSLFIKQNRRCALSNLPITLSKGKNKPMQTNNRNLDYSGWTASLDRIDSSKGYEEGNVQWVHRNVNIMKNSYSTEYFIDLCRRISNHANQQPNIVKEHNSSNEGSETTKVSSSSNNLSHENPTS